MVSDANLPMHPYTMSLYEDGYHKKIDLETDMTEVAKQQEPVGHHDAAVCYICIFITFLCLEYLNLNLE